jgi:hypothetical protein
MLRLEQTVAAAARRGSSSSLALDVEATRLGTGPTSVLLGEAVTSPQSFSVIVSENRAVSVPRSTFTVFNCTIAATAASDAAFTISLPPTEDLVSKTVRFVLSRALKPSQSLCVQLRGNHAFGTLLYSPDYSTLASLNYKRSVSFVGDDFVGDWIQFSALNANVALLCGKFTKDTNPTFYPASE